MASKPWSPADTIKLGAVLVAGLGIGLWYRTVSVRQSTLREAQKAAETAERALPENHTPPINTVRAYWNLINRGDLREAWELLSPIYQRRIHPGGFTDYSAAVQKNQYCKVYVTDAMSINGTAKEVSLLSRLDITSGPDCKQHNLSFTFRLVRSAKSKPWLIAGVKKE